MLNIPSFWKKEKRDEGEIARNPHYSVYKWFCRKPGPRSDKLYPEVPVICCGAATIGGAGKTTVVMDLARRIVGAHILLRGYAAYSNALRTVFADDSYAAVGDEALLHARFAPTWRCDDRNYSARYACHFGAKTLILDDGLQSRSLDSTISFLIVDGSSGFGNQRVIPLGPLREPIAKTLENVTAAVVVGPDTWGAMSLLEGILPVFRARTVQHLPYTQSGSTSYLAFSGIAYPERFFDALRKAGSTIAATRAFPNHYDYTIRDIVELEALARLQGSVMITTPKDAARLPIQARDFNIVTAEIGLVWEDFEQLRMLLRSNDIHMHP